MSFSPITGAAPTVIHTSTEGLAHGAFKMPTFDGEISAYYAAPADQKNAPVLLVVQEVFGLHEHIQDVCRRFAKEGYFAVAVELYERQGDASKYSDIPTLIQEIVSKVSDEQVLPVLPGLNSKAPIQEGWALPVSAGEAVLHGCMRNTIRNVKRGLPGMGSWQ